MSELPLWGFRGVSPGGVAVSRHVDVAAGIDGDTFSIVLATRPIEGMPLIDRVDDQGQVRVIGPSGKADSGVGELGVGNLDGYFGPFFFLPGYGCAHGVGALGGGVVEGEGAVFLDGYLCVVSDPDVVHIGAGVYGIDALGNPCLLCLIGKVDTLPEVLVDDLVGREGLWCDHVGVDELLG